MTFDEMLTRIEKRDNGCWEWRGAHLASGYGSVRFNGRARVVHRIIWEHHHGQPVPDGLQIDHLCRNRGCCNPEHLEAVTQTENLRRGTGFGGRNYRKERCSNGHTYDLHSSKGSRECSICKSARRRKHYLAHTVVTRPAARERTACPMGHQYDDENTYVSPSDGSRHCRKCRKTQRRAYRERTGK